MQLECTAKIFSIMRLRISGGYNTRAFHSATFQVTTEY